jgi:hypothetical protein
MTVDKMIVRDKCEKCLASSDKDFPHERELLHAVILRLATLDPRNLELARLDCVLDVDAVFSVRDEKVNSACDKALALADSGDFKNAKDLLDWAEKRHHYPVRWNL